MNDDKEKLEIAQNEPPGPSRRTFLQGGAVALGAMALAAGFLSTTEASDSRTSKTGGNARTAKDRSQPRLIQWTETPTPDGQEFAGLFQITDANGNSDQFNVFGRKIVHGDSYTIVHRFAAKKRGGMMFITSGVKVSRQGAYRLDRVSTTIVLDNGLVHRSGEQETSVLIENPYEGMSPQEAMDAFGKDQAAGKFDH